MNWRKDALTEDVESTAITVSDVSEFLHLCSLGEQTQRGRPIKSKQVKQINLTCPRRMQPFYLRRLMAKGFLSML